MAGCRFAVGRLACGLVLSSAVWLLNFVNEPGVNSIYADLAHPSALVLGELKGGRAGAALPPCDTLLNQPCRTNAVSVPSAR